MFASVLAPLDGSPMADRILPHVAATAPIGGPPEAITLLRVLETDGVESTAVVPLAWHFAKAEAQAHLDEAAAQLARLELASNTVLWQGRAAQRIVEYANRYGSDLVVLSSHGHGGLSGWNVSGIAQKVIHRAGTSILLIRSSDESAEAHRQGSPDIIQYRRILVPLDGSQRAESTLSLACELAERHAAQLLVVHVVRPPEMIQRVPLSVEDAALTERVVTRNRLEADKYFAQLRTRLPSGARTQVLVDDSVARALHNLVDQEQVDLVLLSAHGQSCHTQWPYSALVNSFITYGVTSLLVLQDLPTNGNRRALADQVADEPAMPTRSAQAQKELGTSAHFEI